MRGGFVELRIPNYEACNGGFLNVPDDSRNGVSGAHLQQN